MLGFFAPVAIAAPGLNCTIVRKKHFLSGIEGASFETAAKCKDALKLAKERRETGSPYVCLPDNQGSLLKFFGGKQYRIYDVKNGKMIGDSFENSKKELCEDLAKNGSDQFVCQMTYHRQESTSILDGKEINSVNYIFTGVKQFDRNQRKLTGKVFKNAKKCMEDLVGPMFQGDQTLSKPAISKGRS